MSNMSQVKFINGLANKLCGSDTASLSDMRARVDDLLFLERRVALHDNEKRKNKLLVDTPPDIYEIISCVATYYDVTVGDIIGLSRKKRCMRARHMAVSLAYRHTDYSLPELGDAFGNRDHTTMLNSINRVSELRPVSAYLDRDWWQLSKLIDNKNISKSLTTHK